jgi:hypothetical protein
MIKIFNSNKRGFVTMVALMWIIIALIGVYCLLFLPIPQFKVIRTTINYFLILLFWIVIQVVFVYGYYKIISFVVKNFFSLKSKVLGWSYKIKKYIIIHR